MYKKFCIQILFFTIVILLVIGIITWIVDPFFQYSGGYSKNYDKIFEIAFETHNIKKVYLGLDNFYVFRTEPTKTRTDLPEYLYDKL